jgi:hypothetical protein
MNEGTHASYRHCAARRAACGLLREAHAERGMTRCTRRDGRTSHQAGRHAGAVLSTSGSSPSVPAEQPASICLPLGWRSRIRSCCRKDAAVTRLDPVAHNFLAGLKLPRFNFTVIRLIHDAETLRAGVRPDGSPNVDASLKGYISAGFCSWQITAHGTVLNPDCPRDYLTRYIIDTTD